MDIASHMQISDQAGVGHSDVQGWTYLMCPPEHYAVEYEINPWMKRTNQPDLDLARKQWDNLVSNLTLAGATIEMLRPEASLPDMVFTADVGIIDRQRFIRSHFRYLQRQLEVRHSTDWFRERNYEIIELFLGKKESLESSDICSFRDSLVAGYGFRTTLSAAITLAHFLQRKVVSIKLIDPRFYHLDLSFCPLDERRALTAPSAWSRRSCELIEKCVPEPLVLELDEALTFCANSLVVGKTVIMPSCPLRIGRVLEHWGFTVCVSPMSEFLKAGGAVHCLALALDRPFS